MTDVDKVVQDAIKWMAAEYKFLKDLEGDIAKLKPMITNARKKECTSEIKKLFKDFRYVGRSERRFMRYEDLLEKKMKVMLEEMMKRLPDQAFMKKLGDERWKLLERLHAEASALVIDTSLFRGRIHDYLDVLKSALKSENLEQTRSVLETLIGIVNDAETWIKALTVDLQKAKSLSRSFVSTHYYGTEYRDIVMGVHNRPDFTLNSRQSTSTFDFDKPYRERLEQEKKLRAKKAAWEYEEGESRAMERDRRAALKAYKKEHNDGESR